MLARQGERAMAAGAIEAWAEQQLGSPVRLRRSVAGGCIHSAWRLELADGRRVFAKTNRAKALPLLAAEREGLRALAPWAPPGLQLPEPLALGVAGSQAVLLLSWLDLAGGGAVEWGASPNGWTALGAALAALHRASAQAHGGGYGFAADNFIGSSPQRNGWLPEWSRFFVERRLGPQLVMAAAAGCPLRGGEALLERAEQLLAAHSCQPALVHGDLWSGNAALLAGGGAALFDPAVYWGDREVDLAMARLFGGFPPAFFAGYGEVWPLPPGAERRTGLYNLYHLLNHANLFGGGYWSQSQAALAALLRT
jgi:fructosamine-3-kinase